MEMHIISKTNKKINLLQQNYLPCSKLLQYMEIGYHTTGAADSEPMMQS